MKKIVVFLFVLISTVGFSQKNKKETITDNGNIQLQDRKVGTYTKINSTGSLDIILIEGQVGDVQVKASDNILDCILTTVQKGELTVTLDSKYNYTFRNEVVVYVPVDKNLNKISLLGAGNLTCDFKLEVSDLSCELKGAGNLKMDLKADKLTLESKGASDVDIRGHVTNLDVEILGAGSVNASNLKARKAKIVARGSSDASFYVYDKITAKMNGAGVMTIFGNPKNRDVVVSEASEVVFK
ncbi:MAG: head GIN domain-containing protein [Bacteroidota bacterium]|nr:head GIN domain-containing protein [Bacteroidota bacterium]